MVVVDAEAMIPEDDAQCSVEIDSDEMFVWGDFHYGSDGCRDYGSEKVQRLWNEARCNGGIEGAEMFVWVICTMVVDDAEAIVLKVVRNEKRDTGRKFSGYGMRHGAVVDLKVTRSLFEKVQRLWDEARYGVGMKGDNMGLLADSGYVMRHDALVELRAMRCLFGVICTMMILDATAMIPEIVKVQRLGNEARCGGGIEGDEMFVCTIVVVDAETVVLERLLNDALCGGGIEGDKKFIRSDLNYDGRGCRGYGSRGSGKREGKDM
ncbi:hypothetical protein HAX54_048223 [Datura stramonium]|uniref:Uncharacterized protein n=1 Tax=Datura stramonium TaxID=4076 RepID=A0ABS8STG0_DATST|nr:hypothetical protein [Datura stramonium]